MRVRVKVKAGARKERVEVRSADSLVIAVREAAAGNAANRRVVELVALRYGVLKKYVRIVSGHRSPSKLLEIL